VALGPGQVAAVSSPTSSQRIGAERVRRSSALVKLYVDEPGHESIRPIDALVVSAIARVEVPAPVAQAPVGEMDARDVAELVRAIEFDFRGAEGLAPRFAAVAVGTRCSTARPRLPGAARCERTTAVQLASAIAAREIDPGCTTFACFRRASCVVKPRRLDSRSCL